MTLTWSYPFALLLLLLIPLHLRLVRQSAASVPLPRAAELRQAAAATLFAVLPAALRVGVLIVLALAVAGPTSTGAVVEEPREGIPIALAIDISSSMLAQDFAPRDRLTVAKTTLASFVEARDGDPISLVALAGEALTLIPATTNRPLLLNAIASLQVGLLGDGTAIGDGLAVAVNRLRQLGDQPGVIVLLSDGENNRGTVDPLDAADAAASLGIRVYTVGVGSEGVAPVPIRAAPTGVEYAELAVGVDEVLLRDIAVRTGGAYFPATDPDALERVYGEIDSLVPSVVETIRHVEHTDWAPLLVLLGAALLLGEWGIRGSRWGTVP